MNDDIEFDVALESQGCAKLVSNLVERLRTVNPYALTQVLEVCAEAADEIERLRALCNDLHHDATCAESFCRLCGEGIQGWEARRG